MAMQDIISEMLNEQIEVMADTGNAVKEGIYITVDPETRQMTVPEEYSILGVESDEKTERLWFKFPKVVGDNIDLSTLQLRVNYRNANNETDQYICTDVTEADDGENIIFSWQLSRKVTKYQGNVVFIVCAVKVDDVVNGDIENEWNTTLAQASVLEGLEVALSDEEEEEVSDIVAQLIAMMNQSANQAIESISDLKDTAIAAVQSQQTTSVNAVKTAQNTATQAVQQAGSTAQASIASDKATALSDIEEAKQNALNSIPDDYTALSELAKETYERMELSKAPVIKQEATGENIKLTDAGDAPIRRLRICGRSQQQKTNGYQLFDASRIPSKTQGGATVTNNGDGSFTISGSGNLSANFSTSYICTAEEGKWIIGKAGVYKISEDFIGGFLPYFVFGLYMSNNGASVPDKQIVTVQNKYQFIATEEDVEKVRSGEYEVRVLFYGATPSPITPGVIKPMVYIDGTGEWEPFTGGKPSPSPEYPQQIKSVGIDTANYFDKNNVDETKTLSGANGVLEWDTANDAFALSNLVPVYPGQWITKGQTGSTRAGFVGEDGSLTRNISLADGGSVQAWPGEKYFCCNVVKASNLNTAIINKGKTLHPYKEYGVKRAEVNVLSQGVNLCSVRNKLVQSVVGKGGRVAKFLFDGADDTIYISANVSSNSDGVVLRALYYDKKGVGIGSSGRSSMGSEGRVTVSFDGGGAGSGGSNINLKEVGSIEIYIGARAVSSASIIDGEVYVSDMYVICGKDRYGYQDNGQPGGASKYTLNLTNQLRGIPVSSGGNYTDEEGQQYICDEIQIDQETKTGVYIQRVGEVVFDGSGDERWVISGNVYAVNIANIKPHRSSVAQPLCSNFLFTTEINIPINYFKQAVSSTSKEVYFNYDDVSQGVENFKTWLQSNPITVVYQLETPTITNLTETQIQDLLSLYTYTTATDVYTEQEENSIQGGLEIQYGTDTKKYIDDKIQAIAQQVLSLSTQE